MRNLYSNPLRIYFVLLCLALLGLWAGSTLPVSLYPNVTQPRVKVRFQFKGSTAEAFRNNYGESLESGLRSLKRDRLRVENVEAEYNSLSVDYEVLFNWNADPDEALRESRTYVDSASASMPSEIRDTRSVWTNTRANKGFFLATVSSAQRSPSEVYELIDAQLRPRAAAFEDGTVNIRNPDAQQIQLRLNFNKMTAHGIVPEDVRRAVESSFSEMSGGNLKLGEQSSLLVIPARTQSLADFSSLPIPTSSKVRVRLEDVADISLVKQDRSVLKTSGVKSVIITTELKDGGNIKRLSENLKDEFAAVAKVIPADVKFNILVDPSLFIRESVHNVVREVGIGAGLAVVILFLFIGSLRNVITAAIEIPLSLILALILMKLFGMNINLISLGGLALSSGMNVDASVVVLENIFRKFEGVSASELSAHERLEKIVEAVKEVWGPILASTIASLVVFIPIVFTSDLTNAILGDLAKAVVFSHVFSAFVALLLVPTVRLQLMKHSGTQTANHTPPIEFFLTHLEGTYEKLLRSFSSTRRRVWTASLIVCGTLVAIGSFVLPRLPSEIIGKPDSELVGVWTHAFKLTKASEIESLINDIEKKFTSEMPDVCEFTFSQTWGTQGGNFICSLRDKRSMKKTKARLEEMFKSTPDIHFATFEFSVAELPLPNPPASLVSLSGGDDQQRSKVIDELREVLVKKFPKMNFSNFGTTLAQNVVTMKPFEDVWRSMTSAGFNQTPASLIQSIRQYGENESLSSLKTGNRTFPIEMTTPQFAFSDIEELRAFPVTFADKILPLRSLFAIESERSFVGAKYVNGSQSLGIEGRLPDDQKSQSRAVTNEIAASVREWQKANASSSPVSIKVENGDSQIRDTVRQLAVAAAWSVFLIFLTMFIQFGSVVETLLVLVAIPLALIGVLCSLYLFGSTLSVNSVLGIILLNGISVANSILLVDFAKRRFAEGMPAAEAVIDASRRRLRPILITSLTTILGMMPIALGLGEGGRVLQPLGIAVSGGMGISMLLTIFFVPALHRLYLRRLESQRCV